MMSLGHQLQDDTTEDNDEREALRKRVAAVADHRQSKINAAKDQKKSGIWNLLSCGGGKKIYSMILISEGLGKSTLMK